MDFQGTASGLVWPRQQHEVGVGDAVIQLLGRWKSEAYKGYIQPERQVSAADGQARSEGSSSNEGPAEEARTGSRLAGTMSSHRP